MAVFAPRRNGKVVLVLMVLIMDVFVIVHRFAVRVLMFMTFGQMQPCPQPHQRARNDKL